jgi:UPF0755 protein
MKSATLKNIMIFLGVLFLITGDVCIYMAYRMMHLPLISNDRLPFIISINQSETAVQFAHQLKEANLIHTTKPLLAYIRFKGYAHQIKAGVYEIMPGDSLLQLVHKVITGDVINKKFTIVPGSTVKTVMKNLKESPYLIYSEEDSWQKVTDAHKSAEGLLLADTYQYKASSNARVLLNLANQSLWQYLDKAYATRGENLPYQSAYELLIAASIIEKETAIPSERKLIAGVVINRLVKRMPLQMDPTVIYALGEQYKQPLSHADLQIESPYNTYLNRGLPPTPIAMVGREAIDAAAHPEQSDYLYYVAKGDGTHQFSKTYQEQRQAINQFRRKRG